MANNRRRLQGRVVSTKMQKTIVVTVDNAKKHPLYGKIVHSTSKFMVHDENNDAREGDFVQIVEARPMSKNKRWALETILERADNIESPAQG